MIECVHFVNSRGLCKADRSSPAAGKHRVLFFLVSVLQPSTEDLELTPDRPAGPDLSWILTVSCALVGRTWVMRSECHKCKSCLCWWYLWGHSRHGWALSLSSHDFGAHWPSFQPDAGILGH